MRTSRPLGYLGSLGPWTLEISGIHKLRPQENMSKFPSGCMESQNKTLLNIV